MLWFHGNQSKFDKFIQSEDWTAFDGVRVKRPVWLSPEKKFAKLYATQHGYVYTVEYKPSGKTFPDHELTTFDRYIELTPFGESLKDDLIDANVFDDEDEAESMVKEISNLSYDVMETSWMMNWLKKNGYSAFEVRGDGPTNLAVIDIENIHIVKREDVDSLSEIRTFVQKVVSEAFRA